MADTEEPKIKKELTPEQQVEQKLIRGIARALSRIDPATKGMAAKEKKESWAEGRRKFVTEARKLNKAMAKEGLAVTLGSEAEHAKK